MQVDDSDEIDVQAGVTKRVVGLRRKKAESAQLRGLVDDPDMVAVRIESQRRLITRGMWFFLALGLGFTTAGVQDFLAGHRPLTDPLWWAAWLAEPMLAGILIMLLVFESEVLHRGVPVDSKWVDWLKRILLGSTLFMNVYPTIAVREGERFEVGNLAIHVMVPVVVFGVAEVMPVIQQRMNQAITDAYRAANTTAPPPTPAPAPVAAAPRPVQAALATGTRLKLPDPIRDAVKAKVDQVAAEGRPLTADDVRQAARVPADLADRIVAEVHAHNGHAFT
ncbi:hypothetical protein FHX81_2789 [Saccharothrix saharensis]|uniref:DUF2637 domain-containing protein n=1 Tax=Saccharothrix saharensis TaxID=571190 RepID=A0A543JC75_9PSEU|nr:hypothetical protein [Saccharothrix saharensis]TQM80458.1 hypothetical protein FHX81_2789 [Saccharothrix saharensis]